MMAEFHLDALIAGYCLAVTLSVTFVLFRQQKDKMSAVIDVVGWFSFSLRALQ